jgi:hypothetical protein
VLALLEQALKLARHLEGRGSQAAYMAGTQEVMSICRAIRTWAADQRVSASLRQRADKAFEKFETEQVTLSKISAVEYRRQQNQLRAWARSEDTRLKGVQTAWVLACSWLPGEGTRRTRLLAYLQNQDAFRINAFMATGNPNSMASPAAFNSDVELQRIELWMRCSPLLSLIERPNIATCFECVVLRTTEINATRLLLRIHNHRTRTGKWPASIKEIGTDSATPKMGRDPWTRQHFVWMPNGIPHSLELDEQRKIPADQPFLLSGGPGKGRLILQLPSEDVNQPVRYRIQYESRNQTARLFLLP